MFSIPSDKYADHEARVKFATDLLIAFKQKNMEEGINIFQAMHMHTRIRAWVVVVPTNPAYGPYQGKEFTIDLINLSLSGDIETACKSLEWGIVDSMLMPEHWMNDARRAWLINEMKEFLGWT